MLWFLAGDARIASVRPALEHPRATVLLSAVTFWEVAIKTALGKLRAPGDMVERLDAFAFEHLAVSAEHAWAVRSLPAHHADPFDRLLVAQALVEGATIVSADVGLDQYDVPRIW